MSATETVRLWRYQGARARWVARSWAGLAVAGVPDDRQAQARQAEGDQALHRAAGTGAGLADADQVAGVKERLLFGPAVGVAFDDRLGGGGKVGGDQGQLVAVGRAEPTAEHDLDELAAQRAIPQAAQGQHLSVQGLAVAAQPGGGPPVAGHGGDDDQFGEPVALDPWAAGPAVAGWWRLVQGGVGA